MENKGNYRTATKETGFGGRTVEAMEASYLERMEMWEDIVWQKICENGGKGGTKAVKPPS